MIFACAVCFGQSDSPMAQATNMGILVMLGVVAFMLAGFGAFIFYLSRRARIAAADASTDPTPAAEFGGMHRVSDSKGMA